MSLLALRSYLQAKGISVVPIDANIDAIHYVLEPARCRGYIEPALPALRAGMPEDVARKIEPDRVVDPEEPLPPLDEARAQAVLAELEGLWKEDGFALTREGFTSELAVLNDALILSSLRMHPDHLTVWGLNPGLPLWRTRQRNPYLDFFRDALIPRLIELSPDLIGVCLGHSDQLLYALCLIDGLRNTGVETPVSIGGAYFNCLCGQWDTEAETRVPFLDAVGRPTPEVGFLAALLGAVDPITGMPTVETSGLTVGVRSEGEGPLVQLCQRLQQGASILDVPSVVYTDPDTRTVVFNKTAPPVPSDDLPKIDLSGLGVGTKYLTPIPMATLMTSRGCYWDKCTFCDHARTLGPGFRELPVDVIADTMESYRKDFGVEIVFFCDESFSPRMLKALTEKMVERDLFMYFGTMCRIEEGFLPLIASAAERGLKFLSFGWESACERIVSRMNKGYRRDVAEALFDECRRNDVRVQLFVMFGFPTETPAEADQTVNYLADMRDKLWGISVAPWTLTAGSHVMSHLDEFSVVPGPGRTPSTDTSSYAHTEGIDRQHALQYIERLRTHPALKHLFLVKGVEDYRIIVDILRGRSFPSPPSG